MLNYSHLFLVPSALCYELNTIKKTTSNCQSFCVELPQGLFTYRTGQITPDAQHTWNYTIKAQSRTISLVSHRTGQITPNSQDTWSCSAVRLVYAKRKCFQTKESNEMSNNLNEKHCWLLPLSQVVITVM